MPTTDRHVLRVTDQATRAEIAEAIAELRRRAQRLSRHDPRRDELDAECDLLVDDWLEAEA